MADELEFPGTPEPGVLMHVATILAATGALVGGVEGLALVLTTRVELGPGGASALVLGTVMLDAALGFGVGLLGGAFAALLGARMPRWRRVRAGASLAVLLLGLFFFAPLARELWRVQERPAPAAGMIGLAIALTVTWWFNAGYWLRRQSIGAGPVVGWRVYAPLLGVVLSLGAALTGGRPPGPTVEPPPGLPNLVLVTIDTLRRDHVGAFGAAAKTPVIDTLAREGVAFDDAITPIPETAPSHASMLTGLHPSRHKVIANGIPLKGGYLTVTEQLEVVGYRTGAFVSSFAAGSSTGLGAGFQVFDDDFAPTVRGIAQARVARTVLPLLLRFGDPADWPWLLERDAPATIGRAVDWVKREDGPVFLWVHLFEPHSPYEPRDGRPATVDHRAILAQEPGYSYKAEEEAALRDLYRQEVEYTDTQVGVLLEGLRSAGALERALVVVVADHGESLGEHGIRFNHHGLYDHVLRVPLVLWASPAAWSPGTRVARQVTVGDIANTLLDFAGVPLLANTESVPLTGLVRGDEVPPRPVHLIGRLQASLSAGQLYGVRDPQGIKYIQGPAGEEVYKLDSDPLELDDLAESEPRAIETGRQNVAALKRVLGDVAADAGLDADTRERLEMLGYQQ
jgi:arylsulfatase A-like enzyme